VFINYLPNGNIIPTKAWIPFVLIVPVNVGSLLISDKPSEYLPSINTVLVPAGIFIPALKVAPQII